MHSCLNGEMVNTPGYWVNDARGLPLAKVCSKCRAEKLARFRPEILRGYSQNDVDEPIEEDY